MAQATSVESHGCLNSSRHTQQAARRVHMRHVPHQPREDLHSLKDAPVLSQRVFRLQAAKARVLKQNPIALKGVPRAWPARTTPPVERSGTGDSPITREVLAPKTRARQLHGSCASRILHMYLAMSCGVFSVRRGGTASYATGGHACLPLRPQRSSHTH